MSDFVMPDRTATDRKESIDAEISILKDAMKALTDNSIILDLKDLKIKNEIVEEYNTKIKALEDEKKGDDENITIPSADTIRREERMRANLQGQLIAALKNPNPVSTKQVKERTNLFQKLRKSPAIYGGGRKKSKYNKRMTKKLMCPKNCCGLPVLKCNCPKSCGHCNCQEIKRLRRLLRKKTRKRKKHRKRNTKKRRKKRTKRRR
tara:strand:+ start:398 stop:1015 length:618 start_codon:yes stop_codon:yes gene_type:complete